MNPRVDLMISFDNDFDNVVLHFDDLEEIDSLINSLEECRAELEHQIGMEKQRKRDKKMRKKMRKNENKKSAIQLPIKLKNGDEFVVTCDDVIFNEGDLSLDYVLNGKLVMTIPLSSIASEPDFEE